MPDTLLVIRSQEAFDMTGLALKYCLEAMDLMVQAEMAVADFYLVLCYSNSFPVGTGSC